MPKTHEEARACALEAIEKAEEIGRLRLFGVEGGHDTGWRTVPCCGIGHIYVHCLLSPKKSLDEVRTTHDDNFIYDKVARFLGIPILTNIIAGNDAAASSERRKEFWRRVLTADEIPFNYGEFRNKFYRDLVEEEN